MQETNSPKVKTPNSRPDLAQNEKLNKRYMLFCQLIEELKKRELPEDVVSGLNQETDRLNAMEDANKSLSKVLRSVQSKVLRLLEKELKLVVKNHYRNMWIALGIGVFGVPIGVALGSGLGNMGLIGIGMPFGLFIGIALGMSMDKKAKEKGNQLDVDLLGG